MNTPTRRPGRRVLGLAAAERLVALRSRRAISRLVAVIREEEDFGTWASRALVRLEPAGVDALAGALEAGSLEERLRVLDALSEIGDGARAAVPAIVRCLESGERDLQRKALSMLASLEPAHQALPRAARALLRHEESWEAAAAILEEIGEDPLAILVEAFEDRPAGRSALLAVIEELVYSRPFRSDSTPPRLVDALARALPASAPDLQSAILEVLDEHSLFPASLRAMSAVLPFIDDENADLREAAAELLSVFASEGSAALPGLEALLEDVRPPVRAAGIRALVELSESLDPFPEPPLFRRLLPRLADGAESVRIAAIEALGLELAQGGSAAFRELLPAFAAALGTASKAERLAAVKALAAACSERHRKDIVAPLQRALGDPALEVRAEAARALAIECLRAPEAPLEELLRAALRDPALEVRLASAEVLHGLDGSIGAASDDVFREVFESDDERLVGSLLEHFEADPPPFCAKGRGDGLSGCPKTGNFVRQLFEVLLRGRDVPASIAERIIAERPPEELAALAPDLLGRLRRGRGAGNVETLRALVRLAGVVPLPPAEATPVLQALVDDPDPRLRDEVAKTLVSLSCEHLPILLPLIEQALVDFATTEDSYETDSRFEGLLEAAGKHCGSDAEAASAIGSRDRVGSRSLKS
jgi:HEAT repeat protein